MEILRLMFFRFTIYFAFFLFCIAFIPHKIIAQYSETKSVLYINSYSITYSWGDSVAKGITGTFSQHPNINLYVEHLDSKRFGNSDFREIYLFLKNKYRNVKFDVAIVSDNDALDFMTIYGDSLIPEIPVVFCGINNPEDYPIENSRFYGIKEGVDQDSVNHLILKIIPEAKKLYFLFDQTTTSLVNLKYVRELENKYSGRVEFVYILNTSVDSVLKLVSTFEKGNAIAIIDIFQDIDLKPVNSDFVAQEIAKISPVPVFIDSETSFGKGILGGIFNKGALHGRDAALLALNFLENKNFEPENRVSYQKDSYFFDYKILKRYNISLDLLPENSVIINKPSTEIKKYVIFIFGLILFAGLLIIIIFYFMININRRKKAEQIVQEKLDEIEKQNIQLGEANKVVSEMNSELAKLNEYLSHSNSALLEAKLKAEESDKLKSAFLSNMSHEIRTPLNAIVGFSNLSADPSLSSEDRENFSEIIRLNSDQLLKLIDDILDFSKIEAGQLHVINELFSVQEIYSELYHSGIQSIAEKKTGLHLSDFVRQNNLMLNSDRTRFKQIVSNFLSNAIKFTPEGFIELGYYINDSKIPVFYVKDTGIGINPQNSEHIFTRFWKYEGHKKFYSGTGLGLAICKKLSELLGGEIWFESKANEGSTFYFTVPQFFFIKEAPVEPNLVKTPVIRPDWSGYSLVIAEDEEYNLQYLVEVLKPTKIKVTTFSNGLDVVTYFSDHRKNKTDLLLMDIKMPQMDGVEAARIIKTRCPDLPIVAQTAYATVADIKKIKTADFDDYITKPIKAVDLIQKIQSYLIRDLK